ncbi:thiamine phosphate synthase [Methanosphaera sp.]
MSIDYSVYLVTDQFDFSEDEFLNIIEEAVIGGTTVVQIREKNSSTRDFYNLAIKVKEITDKYDVPLIINDRVDIAQAVDSAGVHLGQDDMPCKVAREILGPDKIIGISAENYDDAKQAQLDGADYLGIGAIQKTATKEDCDVIPREDLLKIKETITVPYVAIGGVKEYNTQEIIENYDFDGVAIVSAIMKHENPREAATNFHNLVNNKK